MDWFIRPAREDDLDSVLALAELTGGGFTNLPPNRESLAKRLAWSAASFARAEGPPENELYLLLLVEAATGRVGGTAMLFSKLGIDWPFYSYKMSRVNQTSKELSRSFTNDVLYLVNDFNGASEVGGLFLHPELRTGGLGKLLARSRYLFLARHRERFNRRVIAELRGWLDDDGGSPFWDGLGRVFFGMPFQEADRFNSVHGNQFIADLMPKHPIYTAMLPEPARAVIGKPHDSGIPAMRMLEREGFAFDGYIDIFDGGPTLAANIDRLRTVRYSNPAPVAAIAEPGGEARALLASGTLLDFRVWQSRAALVGGALSLTTAEAKLHEVEIGDTLTHVEA